ncbi:hypothetical protein M422DRAFT_246978 [Sphaerobolus stellatus SS14]|nr:hypothetical protein M422DRAFT_246978 [Sphaerobolus stellatus SS14]
MASRYPSIAFSPHGQSVSYQKKPLPLLPYHPPLPNLMDPKSLFGTTTVSLHVYPLLNLSNILDPEDPFDDMDEEQAIQEEISSVGSPQTKAAQSVFSAAESGTMGMNQTPAIQDTQDIMSDLSVPYEDTNIVSLPVNNTVKPHA